MGKFEAFVAPHVGAWIEIMVVFALRWKPFVAPHVGAWIEILHSLSLSFCKSSRTPRGCVD